MSEIKPMQKAARLDTDRIRLWFQPNSPVPDGDYLMRGGICWPISTPEGWQGAALVTGRHEETGAIYVLEEKPFVCIDHIVLPGGALDHEGLAPWFSEMWGTWFCLTYYWNQDTATKRQYVRDVLRSPMVEPKPVIPQVQWQDWESALSQVFLLDAQGRLVYRRAGMVVDAMEVYRASLVNPRPEILPALHALVCAVTGLAKFTRG